MIRYITEILPEIFLNTTEKDAAKLDLAYWQYISCPLHRVLSSDYISFMKINNMKHFKFRLEEC